uniref:Uncharacterized protein n=1 Tax=viral metagenome TaxID=1070528 RepID=A0A6C0CCJ7_9ZZZZ
MVKKSEFERKFIVLGASGNKYSVKIGVDSCCTCPDFENNDNICKHMYFIVLRILNSKITQKKYSKNVLKKMFDNIPSFLEDDLFVDSKAQNNFQKNNKKEIAFVQQKFDDNCPVCLEGIKKNQSLYYCKYQCGKSVHKKCFNIWIKKTNRSKCLFCSYDWPNNDDNESSSE